MTAPKLNTKNNKASDLRAMLAPTVQPSKGSLNWLDQNGKLLPQDTLADQSDARKPGHGKTGKNDPAQRQPEVSPEKLRKHAT